MQGSVEKQQMASRWYPDPTCVLNKRISVSQIHGQLGSAGFSLELPYFDNCGNKGVTRPGCTSFRVLPENAAFSSTPVLSAICKHPPTTSYRLPCSPPCTRLDPSLHLGTRCSGSVYETRPGAGANTKRVLPIKPLINKGYHGKRSLLLRVVTCPSPQGLGYLFRVAGGAATPKRTPFTRSPTSPAITSLSPCPQ
jgi:hypothetical protein